MQLQFTDRKTTHHRLVGYCRRCGEDGILLHCEQFQNTRLQLALGRTNDFDKGPPVTQAHLLPLNVGHEADLLKAILDLASPPDAGH